LFRTTIVVSAFGAVPLAMPRAQPRMAALEAPSQKPGNSDATGLTELSATLKVLLDQASYWRAKNNPDQERHALDRAVQLDPHNPAVLAMLARLAGSQDADPRGGERGVRKSDERRPPEKPPEDVVPTTAATGDRSSPATDSARPRSVGITPNTGAVTASMRAVPLTQVMTAAGPPEMASRSARVLAVNAGATPSSAQVPQASGSGQEPRMAPAIGRALLRRDPTNLAARRAAVEGAIKDGDWTGAEATTQDGLRLMPNEPVAWLIAATLHRARGDERRAVADFRTAEDLRRQQRDVEGPAKAPDEQAVYQVVTIGQSVAPVSLNPFRSNASPTATTTVTQVLPAAPSRSAVIRDDPTSIEIDEQITALQNEMAPRFTLETGLRLRSGAAGLSRLTESTTPLTAVISPGVGKLAFRAVPTFLSAGQLQADSGSLQQFGLGALGNGTRPEAQHAAGVGLSLEYSLNWLKADVGLSPVGFLRQNVIGGVELSPALSDNVRLRVVGERRPVTDSLLAYAGSKDPTSGTTWGGVTRNRGHGQVEITAGLGNLYAGGGYALLDGYNVASNQEFEAGAGGSYPVWRGETDEVRLGLDFVYFSFAKNLGSFTQGHGGYFSPQSFFASVIPVTYSQTLDNLIWSVGGSLGYQTYSQRSSPVFPNNPALQASLENLAAFTPGVVTSYPSQHGSGLAGGAHGEFAYHVSPSLHLGGRASFQHAGDWNELQALVYLRYILNQGTW
jgi:hypothetical protein